MAAVVDTSSGGDQDEVPGSTKRGATVDSPGPAEAPTAKKPRTEDSATESRFLRAQRRSFQGLTAQDEGAWRGDFRFIQLADPQLGMLHRDKSWEEEEQQLDLAVRHINRLQPRFVVVCGDLINAWPESDAKVVDAQNASFKRSMTKVDESIPLVCLCGNHDVGNTPTRQTIAAYAEHYGDDYFAFWVGGVRFLVLNTQLYSDPSGAPELADAQDAWLTAELEGRTAAATTDATATAAAAAAAEQDEPAGKRAKTTDGQAESPASSAAEAAEAGAEAGGDAEAEAGPTPVHTVALSHIPPFIEAPDEPDGYFNLSPTTRQSLLRKLKRARVSKWFCGHYHRNAGGWDEELEVVVSSATGCVLLPSGRDSLGLQGFLVPPVIGTDKSGLRVVEVTQDKISHQWHTLDAVPPSLDQP